MKVRRAGTRGLLVELETNGQVHAVAKALRIELGDSLEDVVPGHRTVLVTAREPHAGLDDRVLQVAEESAVLPAAGPTRVETVVVNYDGADLSAVAVSTALSPEEVVQRHLAADYVVGFLGFSPGFAYLLGLDPLLHLPRLESPRTAVPVGSVAIAGPYSGIYPTASPGGWHLLGRTGAVLFDAHRDPPALLEPGTHVRFTTA